MKIKLAAVGVGNRTGKYLKYFQSHSDLVELVAIVEPNAVRREACRKQFSLPEEVCFESAESFFEKGKKCDGVIIGSPDRCHYEQALMAIDRGMHILLEKPIAQNYGQCLRIAQAAQEKGVKVGVCYVLRFMPLYRKVKALIDEGRIGRVTGVSHQEYVGIDRMLHTYVRGYWNKASASTPSFISKCCHDVDMLLWITGAHIKTVQSAGSLEWYRPENAPEGAAARCVDCPVEGFTLVAIDNRKAPTISPSRKGKPSGRCWRRKSVPAVSDAVHSIATTTWRTARWLPSPLRTASSSPSR